MTTGITVRILLVTSLFAVGALADENADRARLAGTWQVQNEAGTPSGSVWVLDEKNDSIHITNRKGDQKLAEFECNTVGHECKIEDSGRNAKVSLWFSGPKLVELETKGDEVVKRRFTVSDQADTLQLELIPVVPTGRTETIQLKRVPTGEAKQ